MLRLRTAQIVIRSHTQRFKTAAEWHAMLKSDTCNPLLKTREGLLRKNEKHFRSPSFKDISQYVQRGRALACLWGKKKVIRYDIGLRAEHTITNQ